MASFGGKSVQFRSPFFEGDISVDHSASKTKWVCQRHNSMFSPLDAAAGRLIAEIHRGWNCIDGAGASDVGDAAPSTLLLSGVDIERWLAKTLLATFFGRAGGSINANSHRLPPFMEALFFDDEWPAASGLYVAVDNEGAAPTQFVRQEIVSVRLIAHKDMIFGVGVSMRSIELVLWLSPKEPPDTTRLKFRPSWLHFGHSALGGVNIGLTWNKDFGGTVWFKDTQVAK